MYWVVAVSFDMIGLAMLGLLRNVAGDHETVYKLPGGGATMFTFSCNELFTQVVVSTELTFIDGITVTVTVSLFLQYKSLLAVTVYWVVTVGLAVGLLQEVQLNVLSGEPPGSTSHTKSLPPTACRFAASPEHIVVSFNIAVCGNIKIGIVYTCCNIYPPDDGVHDESFTSMV